MNPDLLIIGAGAAGLMCAMEAGKRGRQVLVLDHAAKPAEKIRISGGGRCNFTNRYTSPDHYLSENPKFCISALARYPAQAFIDLVEKHNIAYHEKTLGQLFCDRSSQQIINMLLNECRQAGVTIRLQTQIEQIRISNGSFQLHTASDELTCESLVIACGGLSIPKMKATDLGYQIARQFGLRVIPTKPALVPFTLADIELERWKGLAGVAVQADVRCGKHRFREGMLFTHRGLSGPAMLQISSFWKAKQALMVNLAPDADAAQILREAKAEGAGGEIVSTLTKLLPRRLAQRIAENQLGEIGSTRLAEVPDRQLDRLGRTVNDWQIVPNGTEGYRTAEVTLGGVDTDELSSQTMESRKVKGLYFIGEVVDVTGQLGGFNFQWAWASGFVAGQYV
jgi:predicted Rossmann fold flavoprotein